MFSNLSYRLIGVPVETREGEAEKEGRRRATAETENGRGEEPERKALRLQPRRGSKMRGRELFLGLGKGNVERLQRGEG